MLQNIKKIDWIIVTILVLFGVISTMLVFSATSNPQSSIQIPISRNVVNFTFGLIGLFFFTMFDYRVLVKGSFYAYGFGLLLLVVVYFFGVELNGQRGWFKIPLVGNFQPAEFMKLVLIVVIAAMMSRRRGEKLELRSDIFPIGLTMFFPFMLVLIQPDLGNAVIFIIIILGMLWIGNIQYKHVLIGGVIIGGLLALLFYLFNQYNDPIIRFITELGAPDRWVTRINTFLNPGNATFNERYQVDQSMIAIGSGSLTGDGFLQGNSVHKGFIPYAYADSIFVVLGEEFGFVGGATLLLLYFVLIYRMILIAVQTKDLAGSYMIVGIISMFVFQIFQNIGMLIGIMPVTGITLPFISYGGTSLLINMISVGIALSVKVHNQNRSMFDDD
jgi:rod shape determining protein RodA